jgi:hypothetical protein
MSRWSLPVPPQTCLIVLTAKRNDSLIGADCSVLAQQRSTYFIRSPAATQELELDKKKTAMALALIEEAIALFRHEKASTLSPIDRDAIGHLEHARKELASLMRESRRASPEKPPPH